MAALIQARDGSNTNESQFTASFDLALCTWEATGRNKFFDLTPGTRHVLEGEEEGEAISTEATVLDQTEQVNGVTTRVIEERHYVDGELDEVSRNFFALCRENGSVFYFGEDVDYYENGQIIGHDGAWRAGVDGAQPGLYMPSMPLLGARYYQETAPGAAQDRAEVVSLTERADVPFGSFEGCLKSIETTPLEPGVEDIKIYCPDVGIVIDANLTLVQFDAATSSR
jgi:hypothetical protein